MASATKMLFRRLSVTNGRFLEAKNSASLKNVAVTPKNFSTSHPPRSEHHLRQGLPNRSPSSPRQNLPDLSGRYRRVHLVVDLLEHSHRAWTRLCDFPDADPSKLTDDELGIPPDDDDAYAWNQKSPKPSFSEKIESCHVRSQIKLKIVMCLKNFFGI